MFEQLALEGWTPMSASLVLGLVLGAAFGALGQISRFCLRRAVAGEPSERRAASGVWMAGFAAALVGTQLAVAAGLIGFDEHRYTSAQLPLVALVVGGLMFGVGMGLTRGCISRLSVLAGTGNLRAWLVVLVFAVVAHATLKGVLAPLRVWLGAFTLELDTGSLAALPGGALVWTALLVVPALLIVLRSGERAWKLVAGALIGLLVPAAWIGTGLVLQDPFDPLPLESLSFTLPASQALFWSIASTAIEPGFGVGLVGGTLLGAALTSALRHESRWQSFESPRQTRRYIGGATLMGVGGVLAGGCSVGAGLSGVSTLGISALVALAAIVLGGRLALLAGDSAKRPLGDFGIA